MLRPVKYAVSAKPFYGLVSDAALIVNDRRQNAHSVAWVPSGASQVT
jgi:hypothetical protein